MRILLLSLSAALLLGCNTAGDLGSFGENAASVENTANRAYYPNDELIVSGKNQFKQKNYGKAAKLFKDAVQAAPMDPQALLGYAAASDMLKRFDQSDLAYQRLRPIIGQRVEFLNNYGYSQLLRGNLPQARKYFLAAYEKDPSNPITANNLELLRNSVSYQKRSKGDLRGI